MSYARAVATNTGVQVLGRVGTTLSSLITVALLNASLGSEGWGLYVAATTLVGFVAVFADLGLNVLYLRELSRHPEKSDETTASFYGLRLFTALFFFALAPLIAYATPVYREMVLPITIFSLAQFFLVMNQMLVSVVQARLKMGRAVLADFLGRVAVLGLTFFIVLGAPAEVRLQAAAASLLVGNALNFLLMLGFVWKIQRPVFRFLPEVWKKTLRMAIPVAGLSVLSLLHFKSDSVILTFLRTPDEVGVYGNAYKVVEILLVLPAMFVGSLFPEMNRAMVEKSDNVKTLVQKAFDLLLFAAIPLIAILVLLSSNIVEILTQNNVEYTASILRILSLAMIPWFLSSLVGHLLLAAEKQKILFKIQLAAVVLNIALNVVAIRYYGAAGAAVTTLITELLVVTSAFVVIATQLSINISLKYLWKIAGLTAVLAGVIYFVRPFLDGGGSRVESALMTVGLIFVSALFYGALSYFTKTLPPVIQQKLIGRKR